MQASDLSAVKTCPGRSEGLAEYYLQNAYTMPLMSYVFDSLPAALSALKLWQAPLLLRDVGAAKVPKASEKGCGTIRNCAGLLCDVAVPASVTQEGTKNLRPYSKTDFSALNDGKHQTTSQS